MQIKYNISFLFYYNTLTISVKNLHEKAAGPGSWCEGVQDLKARPALVPSWCAGVQDLKPGRPAAIYHAARAVATTNKDLGGVGGFNMQIFSK